MFGWAGLLLFAAAWVSVLVLPDWSKPENRNAEDLLAVPLFLGFLGAVSALIAVVLAAITLARARRLDIATAVPALGNALVLVAAASRFV